MSAEILESPKTFTLIVPIQAGDEKLTEVTLREPTVADIEQVARDEAKDGAVAALVRLIAKQAKLAPTDIRSMGARDFNQLSGYFKGFLSPDEGSSES
jgi:phage FluMu protein gp41